MSHSVPTPKWRTVFEVASTIAMLSLAGALVWQNGGRVFRDTPATERVPVPASLIALPPYQTIGATTAPVAIVAYSDFECPFCGRAARETFPILISEYVETGKVKIGFKSLPLSIHPLAPGAAAAAVCASQQGRFWPMHDRLFSEPVRLSPSDVRAYAKDIGLLEDEFESCVNAPETTEIIQDDKAEAEKFGISGTPTFIFGFVDSEGLVQATDVISGAKPVGAFREILERLTNQ